MTISREHLLTHIASGDRQADVARAHNVTRAWINQLTKLYSLRWPPAPSHVHGPDRMPAYQPGCADCRALARDRARVSRARSKETHGSTKAGEMSGTP